MKPSSDIVAEYSTLPMTVLPSSGAASTHQIEARADDILQSMASIGAALRTGVNVPTGV